jgi:hypothetical protein
VLTLVLQCFNALFAGVFAVIAFAIARRLPRSAGVFKAVWLLTSVTFGLYGGIMVLHSAMAVAAFTGGPGSAVYQAFLTVSPMANHSRTFLCWPFYIALGIVAVRRSLDRRGVVAAILAVVAGGALGAAYGAWEGDITALVHFPTTAVIDTVGFIVLGSLLILALAKDTLDRHLWAILALHGLRSAIAALFLVAMTWSQLSAEWSPAPWHLAATRLVFAVLIVGIAMHRLGEAHRGKTGRSLGASLHPGRVATRTLAGL